MTASKASSRVIPIRDFSSCSYCSVRRLCLPHGVNDDDLQTVEKLVGNRPHYEKGDHIFHQSSKFSSLFAIKSGSVKTFGVTRDGKEQITGFHFPGELLGLDAICNEVHNCNAVALEQTVVCEISYDNIESMVGEIPSLHSDFARLMSKELRRDDEMLMILGNMSAEQRVSCFLYNLYQRMKRQDEVQDEIHLPMTREEIGNYLGLSLETVSRRLTGLQQADIIKVHNRFIKLQDIERLRSHCM
jgi:CRP/FNR family transcriptional regulator